MSELDLLYAKVDLIHDELAQLKSASAAHTEEVNYLDGRINELAGIVSDLIDVVQQMDSRLIGVYSE